MISRIPPKTDIPTTWMSWTDTPDKPETELALRELPSLESFNPRKRLNFTKTDSPGTTSRPSRRGELEQPSLSGNFLIGFRQSLGKARITTLCGDSVQGYRAKPDDPNATHTPTIGFEHSLSLKAHLAKVEALQMIKDSRKDVHTKVKAPRKLN